MHVPERAIAHIAGRQDNVITREQLLTAGVGRGAIAHRLRVGRLTRIHPGVYLLGAAAPTSMARARAAVLACGGAAAVSHRSAAMLWKLLPACDGPIDVTLPVGQNRRLSGIRVHRVADWGERDRRSLRGVPLTSPARTICDLAATERMLEVEDALGEARRHRLVRDRQLLELLARVPHRRGSRLIRDLLSDDSEKGYSRSRAERLMKRLLRSAGLSLPQTNVPVCGYLVDFVWPEQKLIIEVDSRRFHGHSAAFETDRRRDQVLVAGGFRVVRITWRQLCDEQLAVIARVAQALARL